MRDVWGVRSPTSRAWKRVTLQVIASSRNLIREELVILRKCGDRYSFFRRGSLGYVRLHSVDNGRRGQSLVEAICIRIGKVHEQQLRTQAESRNNIS